MTAYYWDLGFDLDALKNRHNEYFLANGCDLGTSFNGSSCIIPSNQASFRVKDTLSFNAFNITQNLPSNTSYTIAGGELTFYPAVKQLDTNNAMITSPFNKEGGGYMDVFKIFLANSSSMSPSATFSPGAQAPQLMSASLDFHGR